MATTDYELELRRLLKENDELKKLLQTRTDRAALNESSGHDANGDPKDDTLTVVVIGASGDLAKKKTFPALQALYFAKLLPPKLNIVGFARTQMSDGDFRQRITSPKRSKDEQSAFLQKCFYMSGSYDSDDAFQHLDDLCNKLEQPSPRSNRLFYLAIPPDVFIPSAMRLKKFVTSPTGWTRLVVEKPFGSDFASAAKMNADLMQYFTEDHIYRIDHYLGKEMVQNLSALRFANSIFEPVWNSRHVELVTITFKETIGTAGRGGYFDKYGIIRDVMQNHLIQILSLIAMEQPVSLHSGDICDEKVKVLRCISPIELESVVVGQYVGNASGVKGYREDDGVPKDSISPTFAMAALFVNNSRWDGTPFILKCGKGLDASKAEIRIQFRRPPGDLYRSAGAAPNELVLRVQPNEAIYLKLMTKEPGLQEDTKLHHTELDLTYRKRFEKIVGGLPDAYERLILDVIRGDHSLFVRDDELLAAWSIFTPVLNQLEQQHIVPIPYEFGTRGPKEADDLALKMGFHRNPAYQYKIVS